VAFHPQIRILHRLKLEEITKPAFNLEIYCILKAEIASKNIKQLTSVEIAITSIATKPA